MLQCHICKIHRVIVGPTSTAWDKSEITTKIFRVKNHSSCHLSKALGDGLQASERENAAAAQNTRGSVQTCCALLQHKIYWWKRPRTPGWPFLLLCSCCCGPVSGHNDFKTELFVPSDVRRITQSFRFLVYQAWWLGEKRLSAQWHTYQGLPSWSHF